MKQLDVQLDENAKKVFFEIQRRKTMPFQEIAAVTGIRGSDLKIIVDSLVQRGMVTVSKTNNVNSSNVGISGSYF